MMMVRCPHCDDQIPETAVICQNCNKDVRPIAQQMKRCPFCAEEIQRAAIVCKHCKRDLNVGTPSGTAPPEESNSRGTAGPVVFVAMVCIALVFIAIGSRSSEPIGSLAYDKAAAFSICKEFVLDRLRAPKTAEFASYEPDKISESAKGYTVRSHVDAQNGFSALVRTGFTCTVKPLPDSKKWHLENLELDRR